MTKTAPMDLEAIEIGRRARRIRRRRGLSLDVVAGLAGFTKGYLSMLEKGQRGFHRRGLIEDLARALGCSVTDLTGQPYLPVNRDTADALVAVPGIQVALHNYGPGDVPDVRPRPLDELVAWAQTANDHRDQSRLSLAGRDVGTLLTELQVYALTAGSPTGTVRSPRWSPPGRWPVQSRASARATSTCQPPQAATCASWPGGTATRD